MTDINYVEIATKLHDDGKNKGQIEGYLKFEHDLSTKQVKDIMAEVAPSSGGTTADWSATVEYLRANYGKIEKKALIEGMCEVNGKKYSSNNHAYNYVAMAIEYAKQEVQA